MDYAIPLVLKFYYYILKHFLKSKLKIVVITKDTVKAPSFAFTTLWYHLKI